MKNPGVRPATMVDPRRIPGIRHEHVKRTGFWAGRTKLSLAHANHLDRGGRHRPSVQPIDRSTWVNEIGTVEQTGVRNGEFYRQVVNVWRVQFAPKAVAEGDVAAMIVSLKGLQGFQL